MSKKVATSLVNSDTGEIVATPVDVMNLPVTPWRTQFNYKPSPGISQWEPSKTVPDQSMSINEILRRFANGQSLTMVPGYEGINMEEELPDLRKMDLSEIQDLKEENDKKIQEIRDEIASKEKIKREQAIAQQKEKWIAEEIERRQEEAKRKETREKDMQQ